MRLNRIKPPIIILFFIRLSLRLISSPIGTAFFFLTKPLFKKKKRSMIHTAWWYAYQFNFASRYKIGKIQSTNKGYRRITVVKDGYDHFKFYNTVFHLGCVSHILYELSQGYLPIIDDRFHVWDQFFEQPFLPEHQKASDISSIPESDEPSTLHSPRWIPYCKQMRVVWGKLLRDFCKLRPEESAYISNEIETILKGHRVLGVVRRSTDYVAANMAKQPSIEEMISEARAWMEKYHYNRIYLATEDERIYKQFDAAFPGQILVNKRTYYDQAMADQNVKWIGQVHFDRENDDYLKGLEYMSSVYILAHCNALMAGYCGAATMALLLNGEKYERYQIFD